MPLSSFIEKSPEVPSSAKKELTSLVKKYSFVRSIRAEEMKEESAFWKVCLVIGYAFLESLLFKDVARYAPELFLETLDGKEESKGMLYPCFQGRKSKRIIKKMRELLARESDIVKEFNAIFETDVKFQQATATLIEEAYSDAMKYAKELAKKAVTIINCASPGDLAEGEYSENWFSAMAQMIHCSIVLYHCDEHGEVSRLKFSPQVNFSKPLTLLVVKKKAEVNIRVLYECKYEAEVRPSEVSEEEQSEESSEEGDATEEEKVIPATSNVKLQLFRVLKDMLETHQEELIKRMKTAEIYKEIAGAGRNEGSIVDQCLGLISSEYHPPFRILSQANQSQAFNNIREDNKDKYSGSSSEESEEDGDLCFDCGKVGAQVKTSAYCECIYCDNCLTKKMEATLKTKAISNLWCKCKMVMPIAKYRNSNPDLAKKVFQGCIVESEFCTGKAEYNNPICGCTFCKDCINSILDLASEQSDYTLSDILCACGENIDFNLLHEINEEQAESLTPMECGFKFKGCTNKGEIPSFHDHSDAFCTSCVRKLLESSRGKKAKEILCICGKPLSMNCIKLMGSEYVDYWLKDITP